VFASVLPNPIIMPVYADPAVWLVAVVAMLAEIATVRALLRRAGLAVDPANALWLFNCASWLGFLIALEALARSSNSVWLVVGLEVAVVVVETVLVTVWLRTPRTPPNAPIGTTCVFRIVLVGNLVSIAISLVPPVLLVLSR
jgi:hypothetical protein